MKEKEKGVMHRQRRGKRRRDLFPQAEVVETFSPPARARSMLATVPSGQHADTRIYAGAAAPLRSRAVGVHGTA